MIVYRSAARRERTAPWLARLAAQARELSRVARPSHDDVRTLLVEVGELEAAVADAVEARGDVAFGTVEPVRAFRAASVGAAHALAASWHEEPHAATAALTQVESVLASIDASPLPACVEVGTPEGYAFYAVYPEQYLAAAEALANAHERGRAMVIGIRSIGTSLSAAVVAALERAGWHVDTCTVRPRGHPFDRRAELPTPVAPESLGIVVDEGPGLSGSSLASVAGALSAAGLPDDRIVLMPSRETDGSDFVNEHARTRWQRHARRSVTFETTWIESGRLARAFALGDDPLEELSAGAWRARTLGHERAWPAVQPQHERRKYLARRPHGAATTLRFTGFGARGRDAWCRAETLAAAGWGARPVAAAHGFLALEWIEGRAAEASRVDRALIDWLADYLTFIAREFPSEAATDVEALVEMVEVNASESCPRAAGAAHGRIDSHARAMRDAPAARLDARMQPHEVIEGGGRRWKVDALDHHDDHFFPGAQPIAWDVAATIEEWALGASEARGLVERVAARTGDARLADRVPFFRVAYHAHRVGYAALAARTLGEQDEDGRRWAAQRSRHARRLARALPALPALG